MPYSISYLSYLLFCMVQKHSRCLLAFVCALQLKDDIDLEGEECAHQLLDANTGTSAADPYSLKHDVADNVPRSLLTKLIRSSGESTSKLYRLSPSFVHTRPLSLQVSAQFPPGRPINQPSKKKGHTPV